MTSMPEIACNIGHPHLAHSWVQYQDEKKENYAVVWCPGRVMPDSAFTKGITWSKVAPEWDRPGHYGGEENPFEPIKIIEYYNLGFNLGNAVKYILRAGRKKADGFPAFVGDDKLKAGTLNDLKKAYTYIGFEIRRLERAEKTE